MRTTGIKTLNSMIMITTPKGEPSQNLGLNILAPFTPGCAEKEEEAVQAEDLWPGSQHRHKNIYLFKFEKMKVLANILKMIN